MSKCKTVQDEKKINEIIVRTKTEGKVIEKRAIVSSEVTKPNENKKSDGKFD